VGVRTIGLNDESRGRALCVELWYPANATYKGMDLESDTCDRFEIAPGLPQGVQRAVRGAEPSPGQYPLILHSHCAASHRRDAALLAPHVASHGYVVAAPDHPGDTIGDVLADAAAVGSGAAPRRASDENTVADRPQDAVFTLDRVLAGAEPAISAIIDRQRIATCGVSLGGWTGLRVNSLDRRSKAMFIAASSWGVTGPFPQTKLQTTQVRLDDWGRTVPTFLLAGERDMLVILADLRELYRQLPAPKRFAVLKGASHFHWVEGAEQWYEAFQSMWESGAISVPGTDVGALAKATPPFSELCPNWHGTETLQVLCLAHMDAELKGSSDARAFLAGDLVSAFAARGISLGEIAASEAMLSVTS
jgi:predicted dienelactone hydrolase